MTDNNANSSAAQALEALGNHTVAAQNKEIAALKQKIRDLEAERAVRVTVFRVPRDPEENEVDFNRKKAVATGLSDGTDILLENGNLPHDLPEDLAEITRRSNSTPDLGQLQSYPTREHLR